MPDESDDPKDGYIESAKRGSTRGKRGSFRINSQVVKNTNKVTVARRVQGVSWVHS